MDKGNGILELLMKNDLESERVISITHHKELSPARIDVARDEVVFVQDIDIRAGAGFWLEFHSATESRLVEEHLFESEANNYNIITRHKGNIYFTTSSEFEYLVTYVRLKIIK